MTEQSMSSCQVTLKSSFIDSIVTDPYKLGWTAKVKSHQQANPEDPVPFPLTDPDLQLYSPPTEARPWHSQIYCTGYDTNDLIDQRLVAGLHCFALNKPTFENHVDFNIDREDAYGMPQVRYPSTSSTAFARAVLQS